MGATELDMSLAIWVKAFALWMGIAVLAIVNGMLRERMLVPMVGTVLGLTTSGVFLSACIFLVAFAAVPWYGDLTAAQWVFVGLFWLLLTLVFEFAVGRFAQRKTWPELLKAYTFKDGNIWPLVLLATLLSPWLAAKLRGVV